MGRVLVMASQLRWTSKSVEWLHRITKEKRTKIKRKRSKQELKEVKEMPGKEERGERRREERKKRKKKKSVKIYANLEGIRSTLMIKEITRRVVILGVKRSRHDIKGKKEGRRKERQENQPIEMRQQGKEDLWMIFFLSS
jgi:hypothetical protein